MKKTLWTLCLIALGTAAACEAPLGDDAAGPGSGRAGDEDPNLTTQDGSGCSESSLDAAGCACKAGAPARACFTGSAEQAGRGACTYGLQACETTTNPEFDTSAWGPCKGSGQAAPETCGDKQDNDCNGVIDDCGGDTNEGPGCCADRRAECIASGASPESCATLETICNGGSCDGLVEACDPTVIPVSVQCANAYYRCFSFRVNKCTRETVTHCIGILDEALCQAWDAACAAREAHCADLMDAFTCDRTAPCDRSGQKYGYSCTDWGHIFDPCWEAYTKCSLAPADCEAELGTCVSKYGDLGDIYTPLCGGSGNEPGDKDAGPPPM